MDPPRGSPEVVIFILTIDPSVSREPVFQVSRCAAAQVFVSSFETLSNLTISWKHLYSKVCIRKITVPASSVWATKQCTKLNKYLSEKITVLRTTLDVQTVIHYIIF